MTETRRDILQGLEALSDRFPEMRFGQLVVNVANWATQQPDAVWDVEDAEFLNAIVRQIHHTSSVSAAPTRDAG